MALAVMASGEGTTLQAILDAIATGALQTTLAIVVSNNSASGALRRARAAAVPTAHLSSRTHPDPERLDLAILDALTSSGANCIVLAGYTRKLGARVLEKYRHRILNIHPALLPKFGGQGMYGLGVHEAVLAAGETETGVSVHLVDAEYDCGPILAQAHVPVLAGDSAADLAARVQTREREFVVEILSRLLNEAVTSPEGLPLPASHNPNVAATRLHLVAARFAAALDQENYAGLAALLAADCQYLNRKETFGPEAIITSYRNASSWAKSAVQKVTYESRIRIDADDVAVVTFVDHFQHDGLTHTYTCEQAVSVNAAGRVCRIVHRELPGQREAADSFLRSVGAAGLSESTTSPVTYRRLQANDDLEAITRLLHAAYALLAAAGMRYVASHQDVATTRRRAAKGETFVAMRDDEVVGIVTLAEAHATHGSPWYDRPDVASFGQFAVLPVLQRQGIGARLMDIVEARAREKGVVELALDTAEHAEALIAMYARRGYRFIEYAQWDVVNYRSVILSKRLA